MKSFLYKYFGTLIHFRSALLEWYKCNVRVRNCKKWGKCSPKVQIGIPLSVTNIKNVYVDDYCRINPRGNFIIGIAKLHIKKYTVLSYNVTIVTGNHVSTVGIPQFLLGHSHINDKEEGVTINEDVWIGANVTILSGVTVGRGAIIAAGAVVNKDVPPYALVAGVPAKVVGAKFTLEQVIEHELKLYNSEERLDTSFLNELFEDKLKDKKSYGTSEISKEDLFKLENLKMKWGIEEIAN